MPWRRPARLRAPAGASSVPEARQLVAPGEPKANPERSGSEVGKPRRADREACAFFCATMPWRRPARLRAPAGASSVPEARQLVAPGEPKANPERSGSEVGKPRRADREACAFFCATMPWRRPARLRAPAGAS